MAGPAKPLWGRGKGHLHAEFYGYRTGVAACWWRLHESVKYVCRQSGSHLQRVRVGESAHFQVTRKPQITFAQSFRMFALLVGWRTGSNLNLRPHATSARRAKRKRLMNGEWEACPLAHECNLAHRWLECVTAPGTSAVVCWCICFTLQSYCRKVRHQHDRICQWRADVAT